MKIHRKFLIFLSFSFVVSSCTNDNYESIQEGNTCNTVDVKFSNFVKPTMDANCVSCHSSSNSSAGVNLSTYDGVKAVGINGQLLGSIAHYNGYVPMPEGASKLSTCVIAKVKSWIDAGCPNN